MFTLLPPDVTLRAAEPPKGEPTDATEAAAKKTQDDEDMEARYRNLVEVLPPDQQAWEQTRQGNLGNFYLPLYRRFDMQNPKDVHFSAKGYAFLGEAVARAIHLEGIGLTENALTKNDPGFGPAGWSPHHSQRRRAGL